MAQKTDQPSWQSISTLCDKTKQSYSKKYQAIQASLTSDIDSFATNILNLVLKQINTHLTTSDRSYQPDKIVIDLKTHKCNHLLLVKGNFLPLLECFNSKDKEWKTYWKKIVLGMTLTSLQAKFQAIVDEMKEKQQPFPIKFTVAALTSIHPPENNDERDYQPLVDDFKYPSTTKFRLEIQLTLTDPHPIDQIVLENSGQFNKIVTEFVNSKRKQREPNASSYFSFFGGSKKKQKTFTTMFDISEQD